MIINHTRFSHNVASDKLSQLISKTITYLSEEDFGSISEIPADAFKGCALLTEAHIPEGVTSIGENAFAECLSLTDLYIAGDSDSLVGAPWGAPATVNIHWLNTPTFIYELDSAQNGYVITGAATPPRRDLIIPAAYEDLPVVGINSEAFRGCKNIETVKLPESIKIIKAKAFADCSNIKHVYFDGTLSQWCLIDFESSSANPTNYAKSLHIKDPITDTYYELIDLIIPDTVTILKPYTFYRCLSIKTLTIPVTVASIAETTFQASAISSISVAGNMLKNIPKSALNDLKIIGHTINSNLGMCPYLTHVTISESIEHIEPLVFDKCPQQLNIEFLGIDKQWKVIPRHNLMHKTMLSNIETSLAELLLTDYKNYHWISTDELPASTGLVFTLNADQTSYTVASMGTCADKDLIIPSIYNGLPVTRLGLRPDSSEHSGAFRKVEYILIPNSITYIDRYAFIPWTAYTSSLTGITIQMNRDLTWEDNYEVQLSSVKSIAVDDLELWCRTDINALKATNIDFYVNTDDTYYLLEDFIIPENLESLNSNFSGYKHFNSVTIPANSHLRTLNNSFSGCEIDTLYIEDLKQYCELECTTGYANPWQAAKQVFVKDADGTYQQVMEQLILDDTITTVNANAFANCTNFREIYISNKSCNIASSAFYNQNIRKMYGPASLYNALRPSNSGESSLEDITITSGDITAGSANRYMSNIKHLSFEDGVTSIGSYAFYDCPRSVSITLPQTLTAIGDYAFATAYRTDSAITSSNTITIPDNVTSIGSSAFRGWDFDSIILGKNIQKISSNAFDLSYESANAISNINIYYNNSIKDFLKVSINQSPFTDRVPAILYAKNVDDVYEKVREVVLEADNETISAYPDNLKFFANIIDVIIPEGITSIANRAFYSNEQIRSIKMSNTVVNIGQYAFYYCSNLIEIAFSENLTVIPKYACYNCNSLLSVVIPNSVTIIEDSAFGYCQKLLSVTLGSNVTNISSYAFYRCESLREVVNNSNLAISAGSSNYGYIAKYAVSIHSGISEISIDTYNDNYLFAIIEEVPFLISCLDIQPSLELPKDYNGRKYVIAARLFYQSDILENIHIPSGVDIIENEAFAYCYKLKNVIIDEGVRIINANAFYYCSGLVSVILPNSIEYIGNYAFYDCSNLSTINLPESLDDIDINNIFYGCNNLSYNIYKNTRYLGTLTNPYKFLVSVVDPFISEAEIAPQTFKIIQNAFRGCHNLEHIVIPVNVKSLDRDIFYGCSSLKRAEIYSTTPTIPEYLFGSCWSLEDIIIGNNIEVISDYAFYNCPAIEHIYLGDNVQLIASNAFYKCINLKAFEVSNKNICYKAIDGNLYTADEKILVKYASGKTASIFEIPSNVEQIGLVNSAAITNCPYLISVTIPESVTFINSEEFTNCIRLCEIINKSSVVLELSQSSASHILGIHSESSKIASSDEYQFYVDDDITYLINYIGKNNVITLPETYARRNYAINSYAFYRCGINKITVPDTIKDFRDYAFAECNDLIEIVMPKSIEKIGQSLFSGCSIYTATIPYTLLSQLNRSILKDLTLYNGELPSSAFTSYNRLTRIALLDGIYKISNQAFSGCTSIKEVIIGDDITNIDDSAFYNCENLSKVIFGNNVQRIGQSAFYNCSTLTDIDLPDSLTILGNSAFEYCYNLKRVTIPGSVLTLESSTFADCSTLSDINIGYGVKSLGSAIFRNCSKLVAIDLPGSITQIADYAFCYCSELTSITIPDSVINLGSYAFANCMHLRDVSLGNGLNIISSYTFNYCDELRNVNLGTNITEIHNNAFYNCYQLSRINFGEQLRYIGDSAFADCSALTAIAIPDSVTSIGISAFSSCVNVAELYIGKGLTTIPKYAFQYCRQLSSITIPANIAHIDESAFAYCSHLQNVNIVEGVRTIGRNAFSGCQALQILSLGSSLQSIDYYAFNTNGSPIDVYYRGNLTTWCNIDFASTSSNPLYTHGKLWLKNALDEYVLLTELIIPDDITEIKQYAFNGYDRSTSLKLPNALISIHNSAFRDCTKLTDIIIPNTVTNIGSSAFYGCTSVAQITIGTNVQNIGSYAFYNCTNLVELNFNARAMNDLTYDTNRLFVSNTADRHGITVNIGPDVTKIPAYLFYSRCYAGESDVIVEQVTFAEDSICEYIGDNAFTYGRFTDIRLPNSLLGIGNSAFKYCSNLTAIMIPDAVTNIGNTAFEYCSNLTAIMIPDHVQTIGSGTFRYCRELVNAVIGKAVTTIGDNAFYECTKLAIIVNRSELPLQAGLTNYGYVACYASVVLPGDVDIENVIIADDWAFYIDPEDNYHLVAYSRPFTDSLKLSGGYNGIPYQIDAGAFKNLNIKTIQILDGVSAINDEAFISCPALEAIFISATVEYLGKNCFNSSTKVFLETTEPASSWDPDWNASGATIYYGYHDTPREYRFEVNGGSPIESITCVYLETLPEPEKVDMYFVGWYSDADFSGQPITGIYYSNDKTTLYAKWSAEPLIVRDGSSFAQAVKAKVNQSYYTEINTAGSYYYFEFTPSTSGSYIIHSQGEHDTYGYLYDKNYNQLTYNDDGNWDDDWEYNQYNFAIARNLNAGETYYIGVRFYSSTKTGNFTMVFKNS